MKEFPDEHLSVSASKLFCQACREEISTKLSVLKSHVKSKKHAAAIAKMKKSEARDCVLKWWENASVGLPHWSVLARQVLLVQPSFATAETSIFSPLKFLQ